MSSRDRFAKKLLAHIRRTTTGSEWRYDAAGFRLEASHGPALNLHNAFDEYCRAGFFRRGEVVRRYASAALVPEMPKEFAAARDSILPKVRERFYYASATLWAEVEAKEMTVPVHKPLSEDLIVEL